MPYRIDPDRDRQRRADLLERHAANRRQSAALTDELTALGGRSRALREQLEAIRREHDAIDRELAALAGQPLPPPSPAIRSVGPGAAHEARSGALFFGLAIAGAAAVMTAVTLIGTRTIASAALAEGWERWGQLTMRAEPSASPPPVAKREVDHGAIQHAFAGDAARGPRPLIVDQLGDVRVLDRSAAEKALTGPSLFGSESPVRVTKDRDLEIHAGVGSLLHRLGFRSGDLLESINGFDVRDPERALQAYESVRDDALVVVRVRREGRTRELLFALTEI